MQRKDWRSVDLKTREPVVAGAFYPSSKKELGDAIDYFLDKSKSLIDKASIEGKIKGIIVPHAGYIYSALVAGAGFNLLKKQNFPASPKILLLGPSHNAVFEGLATSSYEFWETPLGKVKVDEITKELVEKNPELIIISNDAHRKEHCLEVELPFLQKIFSNFSIIPLLTGEGDANLNSKILEEVLPKIDLIIASSDLSHYYPYDKAISIDSISNETIPSLDILEFVKNGEACGKQGIATLMNLARDEGWKGKFVTYKNSGDTAGDRSQVVGYGCYLFYE